jgi:hypothetical protein
MSMPDLNVHSTIDVSNSCNCFCFTRKKKSPSSNSSLEVKVDTVAKKKIKESAEKTSSL